MTALNGGPLRRTQPRDRYGLPASKEHAPVDQASLWNRVAGDAMNTAMGLACTAGFPLMASTSRPEPVRTEAKHGQRAIS